MTCLEGLEWPFRDKLDPKTTQALLRTLRGRILIDIQALFDTRSLGGSPEAVSEEAASIDSLSHVLSAFVHVPRPRWR
jgi:hypothetical protein